jgi:hypothetical protein
VRSAAGNGRPGCGAQQCKTKACLYLTWQKRAGGLAQGTGGSPGATRRGALNWRNWIKDYLHIRVRERHHSPASNITPGLWPKWRLQLCCVGLCNDKTCRCHGDLIRSIFSRSTRFRRRGQVRLLRSAASKRAERGECQEGQRRYSLRALSAGLKNARCAWGVGRESQRDLLAASQVAPAAMAQMQRKSNATPGKKPMMVSMNNRPSKISLRNVISPVSICPRRWAIPVSNWQMAIAPSHA